ncbi:MAG: hypothetical protein QNJ91_11275 [Gammaproteobacteria bacterium]|nr:hypothetical protein [Gammaproteobacteria bacterium]
MTTLTSLYLAPESVQAAPARDAVLHVLRELDVIADALGPGSYRAGTGFVRHVTYAGCAPALVLEPPADGNRRFCHVAVHGPFPHPRLVTGPNTVKPRCPDCRARFADWRDALQRWRGPDAVAVCGTCGARHSPHRLDWRQHAISGRVLVELRNVFPGEAAPGDTLLRTLRDATGTAWRYGWAAYLDSDGVD